MYIRREVFELRVSRGVLEIYVFFLRGRVVVGLFWNICVVFFGFEIFVL